MDQVADEYAVLCPKCRMQAVASMVRIGTTGTYQEPFTKLGAARITCTNCGFCRDTPPDEEGNYELWYATDFQGHRLWANHRRHLEFLIDWLDSGAEERVTNIATRAYVAALPKWLSRGRDRAAVAARLRRLRGDADG